MHQITELADMGASETLDEAAKWCLRDELDIAESCLRRAELEIIDRKRRKREVPA